MRENDDRKAALKKLRTLVYSTKQDVEIYRKNLEDVFYAPILPNHVECYERIYSGISCDLLMPVVYSSKRIMIYIHGGCFVGGSKKAWRGFCSTLAAASSCRVLIPEFRLAPAYAFPAAIEDVQNVFRGLYMEEQIACSLDGGDAKSAVPEIIVAADGSGASIALALVQSLKDKFKNCISNIILFSPWLNLSPSAEIISKKKIKDEILTGDCVRRSGDVYTYTSNLENKLVSPVFAEKEDFQGFPPVFIQMGEKEILRPDAEKFAQKLRDAKVICTMDVWPGMVYMFQMADEYLYEAHLAIEKVGKLITQKPEELDYETLHRSPVLESSLNSEA